jgi:hypothetical protein
VTEQVPAPAEILRRLRPIPTYRDHPSTSGHDIEGVDPSGAPCAVAIVGSAEPVLLLFLSSSCLGCRDLWEGAADLRRALGREVRLVVVTRGPEQEDVAAIAGLASGSGAQGGAGADEATGVVMSSQSYLDYGVGGPPFYALTVGPEVRTEGVAWGVTETAEAVQRALAGPGSP